MTEHAGDLPASVRRFLDASPQSRVWGPDLAAGSSSRVAVVAADRAELRDLAAVATSGARAPVVGVFVARGTSPVTLVPRMEWPPCEGIEAGPDGDGWLTVLRFADAVDVTELVAELARQSVCTSRASRITAVDPAAPPGALGHDVRTINPIGFVAATEPALALSDLDLRAGASEALVTSLRQRAGVHADTWGAEALPIVACLAMAGVPVVGEPPAEAAAVLGSGVSSALAAAVDLTDVLAREEHSLVLRRAALDAFGTGGSAQPDVSVVLATRRPEMVDFAVGQVARQRGVRSLELVLAPHGFDVEEARVRDLLGPHVSLQVAGSPGSALFGDVLAGAVEVSSGDVVLKMDDDDWYAADAIADLLRARRYSGADLVGMPAEFHYVAPRDLTVKRGHPSEGYARFVAGGTMMIDRALLGEVGSFRAVRKWVDAQLLAAVFAAGGVVYRTHGLGYLLRRNASGHTWEIDLEQLLDPARIERSWPGFHPPRLLTVDPAHRP